MIKYLNVIVVSFFSVFACTYDFGLALVVPILFIYALNNSKHIIIMIPLSVLSAYFFFKDILISLIVIYILITLYLLLFSKKNSVFLCVLFNILMIFISYMLNSSSVNIDLSSINIFNDNNLYDMSLYVILLYTLASTLFLTCLYLLLKSSEEKFIYFEVVALFVSIASSSVIESNINVSFILGVFYAMILTFNVGIYVSACFSSFLSVFIYYAFKIDYSLILPFVSILYLINNIASGFIMIIISTVIAFMYPEYFNICLIVDIECILFEILRNRGISKRVIEKETIKDGYNDGLDILNKDIIAFSSFLDMCATDTDNNKQYHKKLNEGINSLISNYCNKCHVRGKCNQMHIKEHLKELIYNSKNNTYDINHNEVLSVCPYNIEMRKSAIIIYDSLNNMNIKSKNMVITEVLSGISNMLRQFIVDSNMKKELNYEDIYKIKKAIVDSGYNLSYFKCKKQFEDDFIIEVGIRGREFDDFKKGIEKICNKYFVKKVTLEYDKNENGKTYFRIIPKVMCKIEYGKSNIASGTISGDNVLVKETTDGKTIAVICDGMGKGYSANLSSEAVVRMIDELYKSTISSYAMIQILNTYCGIKDSIDNFCTLDYMELNRRNNEMIFYKMSSAPSYIFHKDKKIEKINNKRLPLGKESEIITDVINVQVGDVIVMSSDGLFDNVINESKLENLISEYTHLSVEKIVCKILDYIRHEKTITDDDLSLIVLKVLPY